MEQRTHKIRDSMNSLTTNDPTADDDRLMWYKPTRDNRNYYSLVDRRDDGEESQYFDVWLETEFTGAGTRRANVTVTVYLYDCTQYAIVDEWEILDQRVGGHQPTDQCVLNNLDGAYQDQIGEAMAEFTERAEERATIRLDEQDD